MNRSETPPRSFSPDRLAATLNEVGGPARPDYLSDIVAQASRRRQRPAWTFPERWIPVDIAVRRQGVPRSYVLLGVITLLLALVVVTVLVGATRPAPPPLPAASNGQIAFVSEGDILVMEPDGTGRRTLISDVGDSAGVAYSPDGGRLAYWLETSGNSNLVVANADGSNPITVAAGVGRVTGLPLAWSPDGATIAYSGGPAVEATPCPGAGTAIGSFCGSRVFLAAADGSGVRQIGDPNLDARSPDWSPDGRTIAFGAGNATPEVGVRLYLMGADGSNVRTVGDVLGAEWTFVRVDWSRDGSKIVGQARPPDNLDDEDIWVIHADGSRSTNVGVREGSSDEIIPSWAPERDALAWNAGGIALLEEDAEPVVLPGPGGNPVWSPDGKLLVTVTEVVGDVVVMDLTGAVQMTVDGPATEVAWQPLYE